MQVGSDIRNRFFGVHGSLKDFVTLAPTLVIKYQGPPQIIFGATMDFASNPIWHPKSNMAVIVPFDGG